MSKRRHSLAFGLAVSLAAGTVLPGCVTGSAAVPSLSMRGAVVDQPSLEPADAPEGYGFVQLAIRWPQTYRTQLLPASSNRITIQLKNAADADVGDPASVLYPAVTATLGPIAKGTNAYKVAVSVQPAQGVSNTVIASLTSALFSVYSGSTTAVAMDVVPAFTPAITTISGTLSPGQTITIDGANLQPAHVAPAKPTVKFIKDTGGTTTVPDANVTGVSDGQIQVVIPADAVDGNMTITVDGLTVAQSVDLI